MQIFLGIRLRVVGDPLLSREKSLLICNHRTRLDWNWLWAALFHGGWPTAAHNAKLVLKDEVRKIPGLGEKTRQRNDKGDYYKK